MGGGGEEYLGGGELSCLLLSSLLLHGDIAGTEVGAMAVHVAVHAAVVVVHASPVEARTVVVDVHSHTSPAG